jgi:hypothetical protein
MSPGLLLVIYFLLLLIPAALIIGIHTNRVVLSTTRARVVQAATLVVLIVIIGFYTMLLHGGVSTPVSNNSLQTVLFKWDVIEVLPVLALCWMLAAYWTGAKSGI